MLLGPGARQQASSSADDETNSSSFPRKQGRRGTTSANNGPLSSMANDTEESSENEHKDYSREISNSKKRKSRRTASNTFTKEAESKALERLATIDGEDEDEKECDLSSTLNTGRGQKPQEDRLAIKAQLDEEVDSSPTKLNEGWGNNIKSSSMMTHPVHNDGNENGNIDTSTHFGRRRQAEKHRFDDDIVADITEIPDLEAEGAQEDITLQIAAAQHLRSHQVQQLNELDEALAHPRLVGSHQSKRASVQIVQSDFDLSLLLSCLSGQHAVFEGDGVWTYDALMSEVSSEMYAEGDHSDDAMSDKAENILPAENRVATTD